MDRFKPKDLSRLGVVLDTDLFASLPDAAFDRLTRLARRLTGAPVALITVVDTDRQVFLSTDGLDGDAAGLRETPLTHSFCQHVVRREAALVVQDSVHHPLVRGNPAIEDLGVAAYLGVPFRGPDGQVLGALCAIEHEPRLWSIDDLAALSDLGVLAAEELASRNRLLTLVERLNLAAERVEDRDTFAKLTFFQALTPLALVSGETLRVELVNEAFAGLMASPAAALLGEPFRDFVVEGGVDALERRALSAAAESDVVLRTAGGAVRDVRLSSRPVVLDGRPCALVTVEDTTDLHRMEHRLHDRETLLSLAVDAARFGVWSTNLQTGAAFWDERAREIFGVGPNAPASTDAGRELIHPDDRARVAAAFEAALADPDGRYRVEKRLQLPDGSVRRVLAVGEIVRDADGTPVQLLGLAADLTDAGGGAA